MSEPDLRSPAAMPEFHLTDEERRQQRAIRVAWQDGYNAGRDAGLRASRRAIDKLIRTAMRSERG